MALETNGCLLLRLAGAKKRVALFDEDGRRIKGLENKKAAQLALARIRLQGDWGETPDEATQ